MTKEELLNMFENSSLKFDVSKKGLYEQYYPQIKSTLRFCPDKVRFDYFDSLSDFKRKGAFEIFVKENDYVAIEDRFKAILADLNTFANQFKENPQKEKEYNAWYDRNEKKNIIAKVIFIMLFVVFSAAVIVFPVLNALKDFAKGSAMAIACTLIASISGSLDFLNGVAFFIYERRDDKKKKDRIYVEDRILPTPKKEPSRISHDDEYESAISDYSFWLKEAFDYIATGVKNDFDEVQKLSECRQRVIKNSNGQISERKLRAKEAELLNILRDTSYRLPKDAIRAAEAELAKFITMLKQKAA